MASSYIKIGSVLVPIISTVEMASSDPSYEPSIPLPDIPARCFPLGVPVGYGHNGSYPSGIIYTDCSIQSGRTGMHDVSGELIIEITSRNVTTFIDNYIYAIQATVVNDGTQYFQSSRFDFVKTANALLMDKYREYYTNFVAVRFHYPTAPTEGQRQYGYVIWALAKVENIDTSSGTETSTYEIYGGFQINIPFFNKVRSTNLYIEEQQPPEPGDDDPNDEDDPADEGGGDGDHTPDYDPIPIPTVPTQGATTAGFVTLYKLHQADMTQFADDMFANNLWEAIKQFFGTPMDFMIGVNLLPFEPTAGLSYKPAFGPTAVFAHAYPTVASQYVDVDCGSVNISKYWGSCFDYEPYTKIQIWLPYIGYRDLPVDEVMDMTVSVKYRCDCLTGDCVAFIYTGVVGQTGPQVERVVGQFYGNCAVRIPFGSSSYDQAISNSIALMGAAATGGLSGAVNGVMSSGGAVGGVIAGLEGFGGGMNAIPSTNNAAIGVVNGTKPSVHKGGAAGATTGYMSIQVPYLIRRIPRQNLPSNYMHLKGYPSNIGGKLSEFTGLAVVDDIQLNDIPAMEDERKEILQWLRGGVLI